jgi:hypothetical protein
MFIEGATKDRSHLIRCECAQGLAQIGPTTFRALLLALHDQHPAVRDAASVAIMRHMTPEDIDEAFREREHHRQTIRCAIREVLHATTTLQHDIRQFLQLVLEIFDQQGEATI